ncbi:type II toxin-antitoxin system prevent-host-death family antitoxin [Streptomyces acidiscabies]|uniref:type II toxin-antitoxin system prevent-host-death family antitoxin n=1 Tax=Streptomyces acidiscabies TaxID=42234 RepID=UPI0015B8688E|nr:type II toxin-antitoxin system prevent-host-death family antitoxin [Streptomyces acidiscabies]
MTYTLAMAADQGIRIAPDGVAEVSMTDARANLTPLLRDVRYGKRAGAFTERGERSAYVVPPEFYEQAIRDRAIIDELHRRTDDPGDGAKPDVQHNARVVREALHSAALAVDS